MKDDEALRDGVIAVAEAAAADILEVYARDFDVERKQDSTPLTEADLAAHHRIVAGLAACAAASVLGAAVAASRRYGPEVLKEEV